MQPEPRPNPLTPVGRVLRIGIVVTTVVGLAFAAQATLGPLMRSPDRRSGTFEIQAQAADTVGTGSGGAELWITDLILDGRLMRVDSLELPAAWDAVARRGSGLPSSLRLTRRRDAAALSLRGSHLVIVLEPKGWSGAVHLTQNGREVQSVRLENSYERVPLEAPPNPRSVGVLLAALLLFTGAAAWIGPLRHSSGLPWVGFTLATLHLLFWVSQCVGTTNDSPDYANSIHQMIREGLPAYFPPGYPLFMGMVGSFAGSTLGAWVTLIQHVMAVGGALWICLLLRRLGPEEPAMLGALLAGGLAPVLGMSQTIMSEMPTLFAMVGAFYYAVRSAETGRPGFAVVAGLLTGWAGLSRIVPPVALLPAICIIHLATSDKRSWRLPILTVAVSAAVMLLPVSWFWYNSGRAQLTNSTGFHLFNRVVSEQKQLDEKGPATRRLLALLEGDDPRGVDVWSIMAHRGFNGLSEAQAEHLLLDVSLEGIREDPWAYLRLTPRIAWRVLFADPVHWIPPWGDTIHPFPQLETAPAIGVTAAGLRWRWALEKAHRVIWPWLCWAAIGGSILGIWLRQRALVLALACVPAGYLLASASVAYFAPRYNVPLIPFLAALAMVPLSVGLGRLSRGRSVQRPAELPA